MKKLILIPVLSVLFLLISTSIPTHAYTGITYFVTCVEREGYNNIYTYTIFDDYPLPRLYDADAYFDMPCIDGYYISHYVTENSLDDCLTHLYDELAYFSEHGIPEGRQESLTPVVGGWSNRANIPIFYAVGPYINDSSYEPSEPSEPEPDPPEPGPNWLDSIWEWFLWQLGINDDYSGDIDAYITGGDRDPFELVTPSPTPSPTPVPSPTPYTLDIIDNNGNPVYTITGIPGSTYNITNTTNNNDGSDFDIFEVDLKIGDGGSTNPRDGLNDVMNTSKDYLSENVDTSLIGDLFSVIPNDWFLFIGVLAALPFIAGFISKLLK